MNYKYDCSTAFDCHGYCIKVDRRVEVRCLEQSGGMLDLDERPHGCPSPHRRTLSPHYDWDRRPPSQRCSPKATSSIEEPVLVSSNTRSLEAITVMVCRNPSMVLRQSARFSESLLLEPWLSVLSPIERVLIAQCKGNFYGPYFAYLMRRHQLRNVYITNRSEIRVGKILFRRW